MDRKNIIIGVLAVAILVLLLGIFFYPQKETVDYSRIPEGSTLMRGVGTEQDLAQEDTGTEQKIIHTGQVEVEVDSVEKTYELVVGMVEEKAGYISNSRFWEEQDGARKNLRMVLRIPAFDFNPVLTELGQLGRVVDQSSQARDITEQYYDLETRLENKKAQEIRYLEILEQATTVSEVLEVERELERIRGEIESMEGRLQRYDDQVSLSTITFIAREEHTPSALGATVGDAWSYFIQSIESLIVFVAWVIPWIVVLGLIIALVLVIMRKKRA